MKRASWAISALTVLAVLGGCSGPIGGTAASTTFNRHQCRDLDWRQAGIADGIRGYDDVEARFRALDDNCVKHGVTADRDGYFAGYAEGRRKAGT